MVAGTDAKQRLIDANALKIALYHDVSKGTYGEFMDGSEVSYTNKEILKLIDDQPTIDAVPVIRCKDCKYYTAKWCTRGSNKQLDENDRITTAMDYCSRAERKEE